MFYGIIRRLMFILSPVIYLFKPMTKLISSGVILFENHYRKWETKQCDEPISNYCEYCIYNKECQRYDVSKKKK
jgi:hypothetical protein